MQVAKVFDDFSVRRWADTCEELLHTHGKKEIEKRCERLPADFRQRLINELQDRKNERELGW